MNLKQRDIVETNFLLPNGEMKSHFAIVVSNNELIEEEGIIYLVLISSKDYHPEYCFEITNEMVTSLTLSKKSYVKCHIITSTLDRFIFTKVGAVKQKYFNEIVDKIIKSIF
jgi:mRNA-degrading endonuclease toxin of MazEF toxin-antitoxin module